MAAEAEPDQHRADRLAQFPIRQRRHERPEKEIVAERVVPELVGIRSGEVADRVEIGQDRRRDAPDARPAIRLGEIRDGPAEESVRFEVHLQPGYVDVASANSTPRRIQAG